MNLSYPMKRLAKITRMIKKRSALKIYFGYALTKTTFNYYRGEIRKAKYEALSWIDNIPREKRERACDGGQHWGHMKTNLAEAMDSVLKKTRNLPITALVQSTYYWLGSLFGKRGHK
ncbi:hypothetical protein KIW84_023091 [Lathyrus oleraceus]|uniref:Uncharacterized protein n=1 Tax=Pisum sativum TaxID=3888 RepID=A0A9D4YE56_PEA|nr:hypothetical protein KIW84_023091 [Pisum sativum]